ncbi:MAG: C39 family peptidase [bacterium]|nr:C39 family peptidase [bacterium]
MRKILKRCIFVLLIMILGGVYIGGKTFSSNKSTDKQIERYAKTNGINISEYPEELIALYDRNPETKEFVLGYAENKNKEHTINLSSYVNSKTVPLLMQWDMAWGYTDYAGSIMGLSGCGPTCLSMVLIYETGNVDMNPKAVAEFATSQGYAVNGQGTGWALFSEGGKKLGLDVTELPLDENRIIKNLQVGNPIICAMGPGDFTTTGHFIVLTGYSDGKIKVNDPNSYQNSQRLWDYDQIAGQIKNLWAFR